MTALAAAQKMATERGYVVIGYPSENAGVAAVGMRLGRFAGDVIPGFELRVDGATDRNDWEAQCAAIFGTGEKARTRKNRPQVGQEFFRCALVPRGEV